MKHVESFRKRVDLKRSWPLFLAIPMVMVPAINHRTTAQVFDAMRGNPIDCSGASTDIPYDVLAIAGAGPAYPRNKRNISFEPMASEKQRLRAGAQWYVDQVRHGNQPKVIALLDGNLDPANPYMNRNFFQEQVRRISQGSIRAPDDIFQYDRTAINTSTSVDNFAALFRQRQFKHAALITSHAQSARLAILTCAHGIPASSFESEQLIIKHEPDKTSAMKAQLNSKETLWTNTLEFVKRLTLMYDPHGNLLTALKQIKIAIFSAIQ